MENCAAFPNSNQGNPDSGGRGDGGCRMGSRLPSLGEREEEREREWNGMESRERFAGRYVRVAMQPLHLPFYPFPSPHHSPFPFLPLPRPDKRGSENGLCPPSSRPATVRVGITWIFWDFWCIFCGISIVVSILYFVVDYDFVYRDRRYGRVLIEFYWVCVGVSIVFCGWLWFCRWRSSESFVWFWLVLELCFVVDYDFVIG